MRIRNWRHEGVRTSGRKGGNVVHRVGIRDGGAPGNYSCAVLH